jgi:hypothetical protein
MEAAWSSETQHHVALQPRRPGLETTPPWKPQNSYRFEVFGLDLLCPQLHAASAADRSRRTVKESCLALEAALGELSHDLLAITMGRKQTKDTRQHTGTTSTVFGRFVLPSSLAETAEAANSTDKAPHESMSLHFPVSILQTETRWARPQKQNYFKEELKLFNIVGLGVEPSGDQSQFPRTMRVVCGIFSVLWTCCLTYAYFLALFPLIKWVTAAVSRERGLLISGTVYVPKSKHVETLLSSSLNIC